MIPSTLQQSHDGPAAFPLPICLYPHRVIQFNSPFFSLSNTFITWNVSVHSRPSCSLISGHRHIFLPAPKVYTGMTLSAECLSAPAKDSEKSQVKQLVPDSRPLTSARYSCRAQRTRQKQARTPAVRFRQ